MIASKLEGKASVVARLRVVLMADDVAVAEIDDPALWHALFASARPEARPEPAAIPAVEAPPADGIDAIDAFAAEIGVETARLVAALHPSAEAPYIRLDLDRWDAFKSMTPKRGTNAIAPIVLALTLLLLWRAALGLDGATIREGRAILQTIGVHDDNAERALKNCEWLEAKDGLVRLHKGRALKAIAVAKSYCVASSGGA